MDPDARLADRVSPESAETTVWRRSLRRDRLRPVLLALLGTGLLAPAAAAQTTATLTIRGHPQTLHLYGTRGNPPVVVSSGDGGWIHLAPHAAEVLAAHGYFVVGFDVRAYLSSVTSGRKTLGAQEEPVLVGVSEGAGLSVLAATDPDTRAAITGVVGLGLPDLNELGWRWRDALVYITHGVPGEPTFSTVALVGRMAPAPLAVIASTHDEFVPIEETRRIIDAAAEPKRLWVIEASNHRFSDNLSELDQRLLEAMAWVTAHAAARRHAHEGPPAARAARGRRPRRVPRGARGASRRAPRGELARDHARRVRHAARGLRGLRARAGSKRSPTSGWAPARSSCRSTSCGTTAMRPKG